jgi:hypothetical protein
MRHVILGAAHAILAFSTWFKHFLEAWSHFRWDENSMDVGRPLLETHGHKYATRIGLLNGTNCNIKKALTKQQANVPTKDPTPEKCGVFGWCFFVPKRSVADLDVVGLVGVPIFGSNGMVLYHNYTPMSLHSYDAVF